MSDDDVPAGDEQLDALIARADLDGLVRLVDARCAARDWRGLNAVRTAARAAVRTGRQLWPATTLAAYRLALLAPAEWAVRALDGDAGRFVPGPLTEVIAQHHTWAELEPLLPPGPEAAFVAHERVLRGEQVDARGLMDVLEIPFVLEPWEPAYALAVYADEGGRFDAPPLPAGMRPMATESADVLDDPDVEAAVRSLVEPWTSQSNGRVEVVCVRGSAAGALGALGVRSAQAAEISPTDALAWIAWAGASGGAHGRRRGAATGRFGAWWLLAALGGGLDDWPVVPADLGGLAAELRWLWWDAGEPLTGWNLRLAIEDPEEGCAWAISAHDAATV